MSCMGEERRGEKHERGLGLKIRREEKGREGEVEPQTDKSARVRQVWFSPLTVTQIAG